MMTILSTLAVVHSAEPTPLSLSDFESKDQVVFEKSRPAACRKLLATESNPNLGVQRNEVRFLDHQEIDRSIPPVFYAQMDFLSKEHQPIDDWYASLLARGENELLIQRALI